MNLILKISEPILMRWLSPETIDKKILLLDLEPDLTEKGELHLDFKVVIKHYKMKKRQIGKYSDRFVACTSVSISFQAIAGEISTHTSNQKLNANYQNSFYQKRNSSFKLIPKIITNKYESEVKEKVDEIIFEANRETQIDTDYLGKERLLTALKIGSSLEWEIIMPVENPLISDFFTGNIHLFVDSFWNSYPAQGNISIKSMDLRFFDSERRPISKLKSLWMEANLWKEGFSLRKTGININFSFEQ